MSKTKSLSKKVSKHKGHPNEATKTRINLHPTKIKSKSTFISAPSLILLSPCRAKLLDIAGIQSHSLTHEVQQARESLHSAPKFGLRNSTELEQRITLARQFCEYTRALTEIALGNAYYKDVEARQNLMEIAKKIIFSTEEAVRELYRKKLRTASPLPPCDFVVYYLA